MADRNDISNELSGLNSSLAGKPVVPVYSVPTGYFDSLVENVMLRIKTLHSKDPKEEIKILSPYLAGLSRQMPYDLPAGYFERMEILPVIEQHAGEEIETLSPLLSSLKKQNPYSVPAGYFDSIQTPAESKPAAKVISIPHRRWFRVAAAAVIAGILITSGFFVFNSRVEKAPLAKFTRDVKKMNDAQKDDLIDFIDAGLTGKEQAKTTVEVKTNEIRDLLNGVPEQELKDFSQQTEDLTEVLMTN
jgi:hypothetical protein